MSNLSLRSQSDVSPQVGLSTENIFSSPITSTHSVEVIVWQHYNGTAWVASAGQDAGTLVFGKLKNHGILDSSKTGIGMWGNTSLSLGATTRFDSLISIPESVLSELRFLNAADQITKLKEFLLVFGEYVIDHRRGLIYGLAKAVVADDTATYTTYETGVRGVYNLTTPVLADLETAPLQVDTSGNLLTTLADKLAGEDLVINRMLSGRQLTVVNITTLTTTVLKTGIGELGKLVFNTLAPLAVVTVYDSLSASGTILGQITLPATLLTNAPIALDLGFRFGTGLTIVTSGAIVDLSVGFI